ncbi:MAG TPA: hypothetical protein DDZ80_22135, partial [Cyanobacteria bacterium UBA8803]|nr:hypothetical protein [Cyanobacteria bacterium UBA8803]
MNRGWGSESRRAGLELGIGVLGLLSVGIAFLNHPAVAQIVPDVTLGSEGSQVTPNVNIRGQLGDRVDGGAVRGSSLFHSFSEFNVNDGQRVYFAEPAGIDNIFSRVTGSNISNILGTLGVDGAANLFLLNPKGILFGPNALVDIQGSFVATTGDRFVFPGGMEFGATNPQAPPLLTMSVPVGVQYGAQPGTITNRGNLTVGQDLTLAGGNLDLQGQLRAGRDLTLQAQDILTVRDTVNSPFVATSGRDLTMQGNQSVDIFTLNHPQSLLQSGGDFTLISDGDISGDAHFYSGGSLSMLTLSGSPGNFVSWYDPIIRANGDVEFGNYTGVALKVEATGSIQGGNIRITGPDATIPADDPDYATLTQKPSVILRAGLDSVSNPNLPQETGGASFTGTSGLPLGITVGNIGTFRFDSEDGGDIILSAAKGNIVTGNLQSSSSGNGGAITLTAGSNISTSNIFSTSSSSSGNGGAITLTAGSNISTSGIFSYFYHYYFSSGNGGAITLTAGGNISTRDIDSTSTSYSSSGNGGAIILTAGGNISTSGINSYSRTYYSSNTFSSSSSENGGAIILRAGGNISTSDIDSISYSNTTGNGGAITLTAGGNISTNYIFSSSFSFHFSSGNGGAITLTADGNIFTNDILSYSNSYDSSSGNGGAITLTAGGNISTSNFSNLAIGGVNSYSASFSSDSSDSSGNGGAITLIADGNISTRDINSYSYSHSYSHSSNGGDITLSGSIITAKGDLNSFSYSKFGNSGNGGAILLSARDGDILGNSLIRYFSVYVGNQYQNVQEEGFPRLSSFSLSEQRTAGNGGNVTLEAQNNVSNLDILTLSSFAQAGRVQVKGFGDLSLTNTNIITSTLLTLQLPTIGLFTLDLGKTGQSGDVDIISAGNLTFNNSRIDSDTKGSAPAGNVSITSPALLTFNNSQIITNTSSTGQAGSIRVHAPEIQLDSPSFLSAETNSSGDAGDLILQPYAGGQTLSVFFQDGATISASTANSGQGGNITLIAPESITLSGQGQLSAETSSTGGAGTVTIRTSTLGINGTEVSTSTSSSGTGGNLNVNANNSVTVSNHGRLSAETSSTGQAGNVEISTPTLNVDSGAKVSTTTTSLQDNAGQGGDITVRANTLNLSGTSSGLFAETQGAGHAGNLRLNPYSGNDLQVNFAEGAKISASTVGSGTGGNLHVTAPNSVTLRGNGQLSAEATQGG